MDSLLLSGLNTGWLVRNGSRNQYISNWTLGSVQQSGRHGAVREKLHTF